MVRGKKLYSRIGKDFCQKDLRCIYPLYGQLTLKSKGCYVTDLSGKKYIDFNMGVGTNFLGLKFLKWTPQSKKLLTMVICHR